MSEYMHERLCVMWEKCMYFRNEHRGQRTAWESLFLFYLGSRNQIQATRSAQGSPLPAGPSHQLSVS